MLAYCDLVTNFSNPDPGARAFADRGQTFQIALSDSGTWTYWNGGFGTSWNTSFGWQEANAYGVRGRWRASKGSAPVNRFTRAFGNNQTEGWHLSMPVGIETIVTVLVPAVFLRMLSVAPAVVPGSAPVAAPPTTIKLIANAPAVSQATQVAVPTSRITLAAVAPGRTTTRTLTVPAVAVRFLSVAPTTSPQPTAVAVPPSTTRLLAVPPTVVGFIPIGVARVTLTAVAPSVTGGGGSGLKTLPRGSGDGLGSLTV